MRLSVDTEEDELRYDQISEKQLFLCTFVLWGSLIDPRVAIWWEFLSKVDRARVRMTAFCAYIESFEADLQLTIVVLSRELGYQILQSQVPDPPLALMTDDVEDAWGSDRFS